MHSNCIMAELCYIHSTPRSEPVLESHAAGAMQGRPVTTLAGAHRRNLDASDDVIRKYEPQLSPAYKRPRASADANLSMGVSNAHQAHLGANATAASFVEAGERLRRHPDATLLCIAEDMPSTEGNMGCAPGRREGGIGRMECGDADAPGDASCSISVETDKVHSPAENLSEKGMFKSQIATEYNVWSWIAAGQQEALRLYAYLKNARKGDSYTCAPFENDCLRHAIQRTATFLGLRCDTVVVGRDAVGNPVRATRVWRGENAGVCGEADVKEFMSGLVWELWEMETWNYDPVGWFARRGVAGKNLRNENCRRGARSRLSRTQLQAWIEQEKLRMAEGRSLPTSGNTYGSGGEVVAPSLSGLDMQRESVFAAETGGNDPASAGESCVGGSSPMPKHMWMECTTAKEGLEIVEPIEVEWGIKALLETAERETTRLYSYLKNANCGESYISPPFQSAELRDVLSRTAQFLDARVSTIVVGRCTARTHVEAVRAIKGGGDTKRTEAEAKEFASWIVWCKWEQASLEHDETGWFRRRGVTLVDGTDKQRRMDGMERRILPTRLQEYIEQGKSCMAEEEGTERVLRSSPIAQGARGATVAWGGDDNAVIDVDALEEADSRACGGGARGAGCDEDMKVGSAGDSKTGDSDTTNCEGECVASSDGRSFSVEDATAKKKDKWEIVESVKLENSKEGWIEGVLREGVLLRMDLMQNEDEDTIFTSAAFESGVIRHLLFRTAVFLGVKPRSVVIGQNASGDAVKALKVWLWSDWRSVKTECELKEYVYELVGAAWERESEMAEKRRKHVEREKARKRRRNEMDGEREGESNGDEMAGGGSTEAETQGAVKRRRGETDGEEAEDANGGLHAEASSDARKGHEDGAEDGADWFMYSEPGNVEETGAQTEGGVDSMRIAKVGDIGSCDACGCRQ